MRGAIAQLGERIVRNDEVVGSIPTSSTNLLNILAAFAVRVRIVYGAIYCTGDVTGFVPASAIDHLAQSITGVTACRCPSGTIWA